MRAYLIITAALFAASTAADARSVRQTLADMQKEASRILQDCEAQEILSITIENVSTINFARLKEPEQSSGKDMKVLRCVARAYRYLDFDGKMESRLLGISQSASAAP